jgi:hypothetical protein
MPDFIKQMLTESDNQTADAFRWLAVLSVVVGLGLITFSVGWNKQPFDMQQFGIGIGSLLAGVGVALKLKPESPTGITSTQTTYSEKTTTAAPSEPTGDK